MTECYFIGGIRDLTKIECETPLPRIRFRAEEIQPLNNNEFYDNEITYRVRYQRTVGNASIAVYTPEDE